MTGKRLIYLVVDNHCKLCMEAIIHSSQIDDDVIIIDRRLLELVEKESDDLIVALNDVAKEWHEISEKVITVIRLGYKVTEYYEDTSKIKNTRDVVPFLISFGDDEDRGEVKIGSSAVDYIKERSGDKK